MDKSTNRFAVYGFAQQNDYKPCDTCAKPNIYFLLYDEYGGSRSLLEQYGYVNDLDSFLVQEKFSVQWNSRSNYNFTAFSMSSALNMAYIDGIKNTKAVTAEDYSNCTLLIRDNQVIKFLDAQGYEIHNYSVFDLAGNPAMVDQSFLPLKTKLISDRTLFAHLNKDIGWLLITKYPFKLFGQNHYRKHKKNNEDFQELTIKTSLEKHKKPVFVYSHFYMPHPPFFYDKNGNLKNEELIYKEYISNPPASYLEYVTYANTKIRELISSIKKNDPTGVILILSDHGYREKESKNYRHFFRNLNAIYYPDQDYKGLYDSITSVNQFRIVFNKLFDAKLNFQKDSTILLVDKIN